MTTKRKHPSGAALGVSKLLSIDARERLTVLDASAAPEVVNGLRRELTRADRVQAFYILPRLLALTLARRLATLERAIRDDAMNDRRQRRPLQRLADQLGAARLEIYERVGVAGEHDRSGGRRTRPTAA